MTIYLWEGLGIRPEKPGKSCHFDYAQGHLNLECTWVLVGEIAQVHQDCLSLIYELHFLNGENHQSGGILGRSLPSPFLFLHLSI